MILSATRLIKVAASTASEKVLGQRNQVAIIRFDEDYTLLRIGPADLAPYDNGFLLLTLMQRHPNVRVCGWGDGINRDARLA